MTGPLELLRGSLLPGAEEELEGRLSLRGTSGGFIDRWMPRPPAAFLAVAVTLPVVAWCVGLLLAHDRMRFLTSRAWLAQPAWFTVHLVVMRLFTTAYSRHFLDGVNHLVPEASCARRHLAFLLGPWGVVLATLVATPFAWVDLEYLSGRDFLQSTDSQGAPGALAASDMVLGGLWCVEWVMTTYVWVLLVGFAVLTTRTVQRYEFAAPLEIVLHDRHYRPFLLMSAQGASILLGYTVVTAAYVFFIRGGLVEWIGLWVTAGLLLLTFVPPWARLKSRVARQVRDEGHRLAKVVFEARQRWSQVDDRLPPVTLDELGARVDIAVAILEADHLERLYRDLGRSEGQAILLRLLAPVSTILLKLLRP